MDTIYYILSAASSALWLRAFLKFFRNWSNRGNPISLAICSLIVMMIWMAAAGLWIMTDSISPSLAITAYVGMSTLIAVIFNVAFYMSDKKFAKERE